MDFHYEMLDEKKFQKLSQALIVAQYPNAQCLPVGQPDGGRDAFDVHADTDEGRFTVFQVKFSKNPFSKSEREVIEAVIKSEKDKVDNLIQRGATQYVFVTNVEGTSHLAGGSIDRVNDTLTDAFGVHSIVWWRDDLDRRLENSIDIMWNYPEILKATDILPLIVPSLAKNEMQKVHQALRSYLAVQYEKERDVKFNQLELKQKLTDLFVDLPIGLTQQASEWITRHLLNTDEISEFDSYICRLEADENPEFNRKLPFDQSRLAGAFLLHIPRKDGVTQFVVEGAPGQGKSTVTQYLCQINRLRLLKKDNELANINELHKTGMVRTPFRLDMRDYATWVSGYDPFSISDELVERNDWIVSLESFLVRQIGVLSGGSIISVDDLKQFFAESHCVIVLDGFDEVADIDNRKRIVEEVCEAATRMEVYAKSVQIIVTSRPAAFSNSPGFPEDRWIYLKLEDLHEENILNYKDKWTIVQNLDDEQKNQISSILNEKLKQQHLRDLARNPMQLTILLHLINRKRVALPDKRTMLYKEYMNLFFDREAEKSKFVQDNRELILLIHGVLAWKLHTQVEENLGPGNISGAALLEEVKNYLEAEERDPLLAEKLLQGTVERVGALVARKEDMFEFDVQPLREYFAASHLYNTARYSPVGYPTKGTKYDRFDALARSFYWTNVTRFYCGFYDKGELDSLVSGIISLSEEDGYALINQPRLLSTMLLSDQVFTQDQKAMKRLVNFIAEDPGFQRFNLPDKFFRRRILKLSKDAGGEALYEVCREKLEAENNQTRCRVLRQVMAQNNSHDKLRSMWDARYNNKLTKFEIFQEALDFGITDKIRTDEIASVVGDDVDCHIRWLAYEHRYEVIEENRDLRIAATQAFFGGDLDFPLRFYRLSGSATTLEVLTEILRPNAFAKILTRSNKTAVIYTILGDSFLSEIDRDRLFDLVEQSCERSQNNSLDSFKNFVFNLLTKNNDEWQESLEPWNALVDRGLKESTNYDLMSQIAFVATASTTSSDAGKWDERGFTATEGLVNRLFFARHKYRDSSWWQSVLPNNDSDSVYMYLAVLLYWGHPRTIASLNSIINPIIENLSSRDWSQLWKLVCLFPEATDKQKLTIPENWFQKAINLSLRAALILLKRVNDREVARQLSRSYFSSYAGDDAEILVSAVHTELIGSDEESIEWEYIKHMSIRAQDLSISNIFPFRMALITNIPESVARDVLENFELHNEQFVASCERVYATTVAQNAPKVSKLARDDDWFA